MTKDLLLIGASLLLSTALMIRAKELALEKRGESTWVLADKEPTGDPVSG